MSLPYFKEFGWDTEVVTVDPEYSELPKDNLLIKSIPSEIKIHNVKPLSKSWTSKLGIGSLGLRSMWSYRKQVSKLLKQSHFDLVYFSTTQFPVCALGAYWKKRFNVPYVIDMQDPWYTGHYHQGKPQNERPPKYRLMYGIHQYLERIAMKRVDGLISVSEGYINDLKQVYPRLNSIPSSTITFGAFEPDPQIAKQNSQTFKPLLSKDFVNIVYIGRGGTDMHQAISALFTTLQKGLKNEPEQFKKIRLYFIGTSYAPAGQGKPTILPLAKELGIEEQVIEITDRISFYHTLTTLQQADALFIPGSDDPKYTASKIYPYILAQKPLLAIFSKNSSAISILKEYGAEYTLSYDSPNVTSKIEEFLQKAVNNNLPQPEYDLETIKRYSALNMTKQQCQLFDSVIGENTVVNV
jgi:hypothetical protein